MLLDREQFINIEYLDYTKKVFDDCFGDDIKLIEEVYSNGSGGMGAYELTYEYLKKPYQIVFDYERLRFRIEITWENAYTNFFQGRHTEYKKRLNRDDIKKAIQILKKDIDDDVLVFYTIKKNGQLKKLEK